LSVIVSMSLGPVRTCAIVSASMLRVIVHLFYGSRPVYYLEVYTWLFCLGGENKNPYYVFLPFSRPWKHIQFVKIPPHWQFHHLFSLCYSARNVPLHCGRSLLNNVQWFNPFLDCLS
jgi:hypothetical protein